MDTLDAVGAFFHDAAHTDGDIGIFLHLEEFWHAGGAEGTFVEVADFAFIPIEEVESADFVWAVICAISGTDAAIVGHDIEAFFVVDGGVDGADGFAWGHLAVLAEHGHKRGLGVFWEFGGVT